MRFSKLCSRRAELARYLKRDFFDFIRLKVQNYFDLLLPEQEKSNSTCFSLITKHFAFNN